MCVSSPSTLPSVTQRKGYVSVNIWMWKKSGSELQALHCLGGLQCNSALNSRVLSNAAVTGPGEGD